MPSRRHLTPAPPPDDTYAKASDAKREAFDKSKTNLGQLHEGQPDPVGFQQGLTLTGRHGEPSGRIDVVEIDGMLHLTCGSYGSRAAGQVSVYIDPFEIAELRYMLELGQAAAKRSRDDQGEPA